MKKALRIIIGIIIIAVIAGIFTACGGNQPTEIAETTTAEIISAQTTASDDAVQAEVDAWRKEKQKLNNKAIALIEKIDKNESSIDPDLFEDLTYEQIEFDKFRDLSRKKLSTEAYEELYYYIEDENEWWTPIIYANQAFYLPAHYYVTVGWASENVIVDPNNKNIDKQRVYTLKDPSKAGYLVMAPVESHAYVVLIEPGKTMTHFQ